MREFHLRLLMIAVTFIVATILRALEIINREIFTIAGILAITGGIVNYFVAVQEQKKEEMK